MNKKLFHEQKKIHQLEGPSFYLIGKSNEINRVEKATGLRCACNLPIYFDGRKAIASQFFECQRRYFVNCGKLLTPGEYGCAKSHLSALDSIAKNAEAAYVFEDDVRIRPGLNLRVLSSLSSWIGPSGVMVLGCQDGLPTSRFFEPGLVYHVSPGTTIYRAAAYLIGPQAAADIAAVQREQCARADDWALFSKVGACDIFYTDLFGHPSAPDPIMEHERRGNEYKSARKRRPRISYFFRRVKGSTVFSRQQKKYVALGPIDQF